MDSNKIIKLYRTWYAALVKLYPRPYRQQFGESMELTFADLCRERTKANQVLFGYVLWLFAETFTAVCKEQLTYLFMKKTLLRPLIIALVLLIIPYLGSVYVEGWNWSWHDFVFAGVMFFIAGLVFELAARRLGDFTYKLAVGLSVFTGFVLVWGNLAAGFIGEDNPANLLYLLMILGALVAAFAAKFRPKALADITYTLAVVQMLIPGLALIFWRADFAPGVARVFLLSAGFAFMFATSGVLFRRVANVAVK